MGERRLRRVEHACGSSKSRKGFQRSRSLEGGSCLPSLANRQGRFNPTEMLKQGAWEPHCLKRRSTENRDPGGGKLVSHG